MLFQNSKNFRVLCIFDVQFINLTIKAFTKNAIIVFLQKSQKFHAFTIVNFFLSEELVKMDGIMSTFGRFSL